MKDNSEEYSKRTRTLNDILTEEPTKQQLDDYERETYYNIPIDENYFLSGISILMGLKAWYSLNIVVYFLLSVTPIFLLHGAYWAYYFIKNR